MKPSPTKAFGTAVEPDKKICCVCEARIEPGEDYTFYLDAGRRVHRACKAGAFGGHQPPIKESA